MNDLELSIETIKKEIIAASECHNWMRIEEILELIDHIDTFASSKLRIALGSFPEQDTQIPAWFTAAILLNEDVQKIMSLVENNDPVIRSVYYVLSEIYEKIPNIPLPEILIASEFHRTIEVRWPHITWIFYPSISRFPGVKIRSYVGEHGALHIRQFFVSHTAISYFIKELKNFQTG
jgi:hypothetical protein